MRKKVIRKQSITSFFFDKEELMSGRTRFSARRQVSCFLLQLINLQLQARNWCEFTVALVMRPRNKPRLKCVACIQSVIHKSKRVTGVYLKTNGSRHVGNQRSLLNKQQKRSSNTALWHSIPNPLFDEKWAVGLQMDMMLQELQVLNSIKL